MIPYVENANKVLVIGTSLAVYPAAGLINYVSDDAEKYYVDPKGLTNLSRNDFTVISKKAVEGISELVKQLIKKLTIKEITNLITEGNSISKKEIYNYCLKLKNEK